jgi:hypothetical protein
LGALTHYNAGHFVRINISGFAVAKKLDVRVVLRSFPARSAA